jgi:2-polyprenyl-3-methyl-5-hydroxy-6-metoxy-1,4-benzoquinol methylase
VERLQEFTQYSGFHEVLFQWVIGLPGIGTESPILDIGCGSGAGLARLARHNFRNLYGVDNESFVNFPPSGELPVSFFHADQDNDLNLGLGATKFGLISTIEVIEHVHNPGRLMAHAAYHLTDNGYFLFTTPECAFRQGTDQVRANGQISVFRSDERAS